MERLSIGDDDDEQVAARWLSTLEETKRMAAHHAADVAAAAAAAARRGDDAWVDVAGGNDDDSSKKQSSSPPSTSKTSTSTTVPRDSGDAWRQEEWHIAFIVLVSDISSSLLLHSRASKTEERTKERGRGKLTFFLLSLSLELKKVLRGPRRRAALRRGSLGRPHLLRALGGGGRVEVVRERSC